MLLRNEIRTIGQAQSLRSRVGDVETKTNQAMTPR